jgi:crotonobetainyl-CoA:carnitine CoA-transferase CaiB-like acyl-CoA transferase
LADDPRFSDVATRLANFDALRTIIRDYASTVADAAAFEEQFSKHQLAVGRVRQPGELTDTDWARARGAVVSVDDRGGGSMQVPNVPWRFGASPGVGVSGVPKYRGEDNREILAELLGYDDERLDALESGGVLSSRLPEG